MGTSARPGAGYFPLMLSVIMAILGAIVLFKSLTIESPNGDPIGNIAWKPLAHHRRGDRRVRLCLLDRLGMIITVPLLIIDLQLCRRRVQAARRR